MARNTEVTTTAGVATADINATDEITYIPSDGDPVRTVWNGLEFKAYVPTKVSRRHTVLVPIRQEVVAEDGTIRTRGVEKRIPMVDLARGNHKFSVNGEAPVTRKEGRSRVPDSSDAYRGYAISWIAGSTAANAMDARWEAEASLRDKCGVAAEDIAYLRPFFEARHDELAAASQAA